MGPPQLGASFVHSAGRVHESLRRQTRQRHLDSISFALGRGGHFELESGLFGGGRLRPSLAFYLVNKTPYSRDANAATSALIGTWLASLPLPDHGLKVDAFFPDEAIEADSYEPVTCTACSAIHFVNPTTGKLLGEDDA